MKVVALGGSPRLKGNTNYLIDRALEELAARGIETEKIVLNQCKIAGCQAHSNCGEAKECLQKDDGVWILDKYLKADGLIVASPVYGGTVSAQMKTFIDRTYFFFHHRLTVNAKCAGIIAIDGRGGSEETSKELSKLFRSDKIKTFVLAGHAGKPDTDPAQQSELIEKARTMGRQMADVLLGQNH